MKKVHVVMQIEDPANPKDFFLVSVVNFPDSPEAFFALEFLMPPDNNGVRHMKRCEIPMRGKEQDEIVSVLANDKIERIWNENYNLKGQLRAKDEYIKALESKLSKEE